MKKYFILILLSFICYLSNASNWDLLKSSKRWSNLCITYNPNMVDHYLTTYFVKFGGDTIINDKTYKLILQTEDENLIKWDIKGYVREDTTDGLYIRRLDGVEGVLYKYNLNVGDTVSTINRFVGFPKYTVKKIDSVLINEVYKKRYTMTYDDRSPLNEIWIEGIGSLKGILFSCLDVSGASFKLLCYSENDVLKYKDIEYPNCYYYTRTSIEKTSSTLGDIRIYPNYSQNNITVSSSEFKKLGIYNTNGILVDTLDFENQSNITLNISSYPKGLYFVASIDFFRAYQKFIKI